MDSGHRSKDETAAAVVSEPARLLPFRPARAHPYLFSNEEVQRLLDAALQLSPSMELRRWTFYVLLGLLSVTGLRVGEALRLRLDDVDLDHGVLTVHGTKFGKSRLVPIHASTQDVLASYQRRRAHLLNSCDAAHFFVTGTGDDTKPDEPPRPNFVCAHCGAQMILIESFVRGQTIRAPPLVRGGL